MAKCRVNWGALPEDVEVSVFRVVNTAFNSLYVLASDKKLAMRVACAANHVQGSDEIHEDHYFRAPNEVDPAKEENLRDYFPQISAAIKRRLHGTLHCENGVVSVGEEVIKL